MKPIPDGDFCLYLQILYMSLPRFFSLPEFKIYKSNSYDFFPSQRKALLK